MCDNHMELGASESREATYKSDWEKWADAVEAALGHDLDGTQWIDGYSIDYAHDAFNGGLSVSDHVEEVRSNKARVARGEFITELSNKAGRSRDDEGEESRWDDVTLYVGSASDEHIAEYIEEYYPSEHCQHEYDCCGHWYANRARYKRHGVLVVLKQSYTLNI